MPQSPSASNRWITLCLIGLIVFEYGARLEGDLWVRGLSWAATGLAIVASVRRLGWREAYLLSVCAGLVLLGLTLFPVSTDQIAGALDQAAFLMAFIVLLGLLHEAASTSPSIAQVGAYLTRQPPARRYYALFSGTGAMAVLFNIGVVSFLTPLIQRGIEKATPGDALNPIRERRQISAMLRGFAWSVIWSPTAIAPLAVAELIPGVERSRWIALGFGIFLGIMVLGALEDRLRFRRFRPAATVQRAAFPLRAAMLFLAACAWLLTIAGAVVWMTGDTVVFGLMVACPIMLVGWITVQKSGADEPVARAVKRRLAQIAWAELPKSAPVAVTLACSGFIGRMAATMVPGRAIADALGLAGMPDFLFLSILPVAIGLFSLLGVSPIMMAIFFGSLFGGLAELPADATLLALSISCGWAVSMTFSPFATVVLLTQRVGDIPPRRLTWGWNLGYSALSAAALLPVFALLTGGH